MNGQENPFCARRIRPGAVPFQFAPGQSAQRLVEQLARSGWWGQVIGPHGSGKSTLLAALTPEIERAGRKVLAVELHDGQRRLPTECRSPLNCSQDALVAIDGYEQLGIWSRFWLKRRCRRRAVGLVVTAHSTVRLPDLFRTEVDVSLAWQVVGLLQTGHRSLIQPEDVADRLACHGGNLRETLFELYDLYEERLHEGQA